MICNNPIRVTFVGGNSVITVTCDFPNISIAALFDNGELHLRLSFIDIKIHKQTSHWTSIRIVIVKKKFVLEVERPPDHAICPLVRYVKPMKPVCFVYFNEEMVLFSGSE